MTSVMSSGPSTTFHPTLVSASAYIHLAPSSIDRDTLSSDETRQLVLEYLCSCCFPDSAKAFAREAETLSKADESQLDSDEAEVYVLATDEHPKANGSYFSHNDIKGHRRSASKGSVNHMEGVETIDTSQSSAHPGGSSIKDAMEEDGPPNGDISPKSPDVLDKAGSTTATTRVAGSKDNEYEPGLSKESWPMLSSEMLQQIRIRRDIKDCILTGCIQSAVELINTHFPTVLKEQGPSLTLKPHKDSVCYSSEFFVPTPSIAQTNSNGKQSTPYLGSSFGAWSLSLNPQVLSLNLQLQSFVEIMRAAHSASSFLSGPSTPTALSVNGDNVSDEGGMSASISSITSNTPHSVNIAIAHSQALNAKVQMLPPGKEKDQWIKECIDVSGLLAYKDLTTCPVRGYLAQERREVLSELVNAALLKASDETPLPLLTLAARQTSAVWNACGDFRVQFPIHTKDPKKQLKTYPMFELKTFLRENETTAAQRLASLENNEQFVVTGNAPARARS